MTLNVKIGLALLALGSAGLWWASRKPEEEQAATETQDVDYELLNTTGGSLVDGSVFNTPKLSVKTVPDSIKSVVAEGSNTLAQAFTDGTKTNLIKTDTETARKTPYPDCSINGVGMHRLRGSIGRVLI